MRQSHSVNKRARSETAASRSEKSIRTSATGGRKRQSSNFPRSGGKYGPNTDETYRRSGLNEEIEFDELSSDDYSLSGDEDQNFGSEEVEQSLEDRETADEKRLRLAKEYLSMVEDQVEKEVDEDSEVDEDEARGVYRMRRSLHDRVGDRLQEEALLIAGSLYRPIGETLVDHEFEPTDYFFQPGHKMPVTCVTVSPDAKYIITGSKDCNLLVWNLALGDADGPEPSIRASTPPGSDSEGQESSSNPSVASHTATDPGIKITLTSRTDGRRRTKADVEKQRLNVRGVSGRGFLPILNSTFGGGNLGPLKNATDTHAKQNATEEADLDVVNPTRQTTTRIVRTDGMATIISTPAPVTEESYSDVKLTEKKEAERTRVRKQKLRSVPDYEIPGHYDDILSVTISDNGEYIASSGRDRVIRVWKLQDPNDPNPSTLTSTSSMDASSSANDAAAHPNTTTTTTGTNATKKRVPLPPLPRLENVENFVGHKDAVSSLAFRPGTRTLFSASFDRCVKVWGLDELAYIDTLFGHQAPIHSIDAPPSAGVNISSRGTSRAAAYRCFTVGMDRSARLWKVSEQTQAVFRGNTLAQSLDCVRAVSDSVFITGAMDGSIALWNSSRKKPIFTIYAAHGTGTNIPCREHHAAVQDVVQREAEQQEHEKSVARKEAELRASVGDGSGLAPNKRAEVGDTRLGRKLLDTTLKGSGSKHSNRLFLNHDADGHGPDPGYLDEIAKVTGMRPQDLSSGFCHSITAIAVMPNSDVVATGAGDGFIRLWRLVSQDGDSRTQHKEGSTTASGSRRSAMSYRRIEYLTGIPCKGIVNGLSFDRQGKVLVAAVGKEHRLGRWWNYKQAKNGVFVVRMDKAIGL